MIDDISKRIQDAERKCEELRAKLEELELNEFKMNAALSAKQEIIEGLEMELAYSNEWNECRADMQKEIEDLKIQLSGKTFDDENVNLKAEVEHWKKKYGYYVDKWNDENALAESLKAEMKGLRRGLQHVDDYINQMELERDRWRSLAWKLEITLSKYSSMKIGSTVSPKWANDALAEFEAAKKEMG